MEFILKFEIFALTSKF